MWITRFFIYRLKSSNLGTSFRHLCGSLWCHFFPCQSYPQQMWITYPHFHTIIYFDTNLSTLIVGNLSTLSTKQAVLSALSTTNVDNLSTFPHSKRRYPGYPQQMWITYPHFHTIIYFNTKLSTTIVNKLSTLSTHQAALPKLSTIVVDNLSTFPHISFNLLKKQI